MPQFTDTSMTIPHFLSKTEGEPRPCIFSVQLQCKMHLVLYKGNRIINDALAQLREHVIYYRLVETEQAFDGQTESHGSLDGVNASSEPRATLFRFAPTETLQCSLFLSARALRIRDSLQCYASWQQRHGRGSRPLSSIQEFPFI